MDIKFIGWAAGSLMVLIFLGSPSLRASVATRSMSRRRP